VYLDDQAAAHDLHPISGSFRGPKTMRATTKMSTSSGKPRVPNMKSEPFFPRDKAVNDATAANTPTL